LIHSCVRGLCKAALNAALLVASLESHVFMNADFKR